MEDIDFKLNFYISTYLDLKTLINLEKNKQNKNFSFYDFFIDELKLIKKRIEITDLEYKEKLLDLVDESVVYFNEFIRTKNKKYLERANNSVKKLFELIKKETEYLIKILKMSKNFYYRTLVFHKRVIPKIKEDEEFIFFIKNLLYQNIKELNPKKINEFFLKLQDKKIVLIIRKESSLLDFLIIEDVINLEKIQDYKLLDFYEKGYLVPTKEENEELEELVIDKKMRLKNYIVYDPLEFLFEYYL